jgi:hypothetical protein
MELKKLAAGYAIFRDDLSHFGLSLILLPSSAIYYENSFLEG